MSIILVLGAIAAIILYIYQMRANAKAQEEESTNIDGDEFNSDNIFYPTDNEYQNNNLLGSDPYEDLEKLATLHEKGILTKEEFDEKKKDILKRM